MSAEVVHGHLLVRRVGTGGVGEVWEARAPDGARVALKRLLPAADEGSRARLGREGEALAKVRHPRVVALVASLDAPPALVLEWVGGGSVADLLAREGAMSLARAAALLDGVLDGLAAVHAAGVVHRDLKPSNVLLADGGPKLSDFGIAGALLRTDPDLTPAGRTMATPAYASPELLAGAPHDAAADLWAAGVLFYECLAAARPFEGATLAEVCAQIVRAELPPLRAFRDDVPPGADALLATLLAGDPAARPRDARAMRHAIARALS